MNNQLNIKKKINLFLYLTMRMNVIAEYFLITKTKNDIVNGVKFANQLSIPVIFLGGGSNVVFKNNYFPGLVIKNNYIKKEIINDTAIKFSSGYPVNLAVNETIEIGLDGFQYHKGLPGTVGGAIVMNSKWTRPASFFGDNLISADLIDLKGNLKNVNQDYFQFKYDFSILKNTKEIVLDAVFKFSKGDRNKLIKIADDTFKSRHLTQPFGINTCGCFFQNITEETQKRLGLPTKSTGYLIDQCGLKGMSIGDYYISQKHANFIVNRGNGNAEDLKKLVKLVKNRVKDKYNIDLEEEVVII